MRLRVGPLNLTGPSSNGWEIRPSPSDPSSFSIPKPGRTKRAPSTPGIPEAVGAREHGPAAATTGSLELAGGAP